MHEMAIVGNVVDTVIDYATAHDAHSVREITLIIGELHDIVDELMESCFRHIAKGSIAENTSLTLVKVPMRARCNGCLLVYPADLRQKESLACPDCGCKDFSIHNGNEFTIRDIKIV